MGMDAKGRLVLHRPHAPATEDFLDKYLEVFGDRVGAIVAKAADLYRRDHTLGDPLLFPDMEEIMVSKNPPPDHLEFRLPFISPEEARQRLLGRVLALLSSEGGIPSPPPTLLLDTIFSDYFFGHPFIRCELEYFLPRILKSMVQCVHEGLPPVFDTEENMACIKPFHLASLYTALEWRGLVERYLDEDLPIGADRAEVLRQLTDANACNHSSADGCGARAICASGCCGEGAAPLFDPQSYDTTFTLSSWLRLQDARRLLGHVQRLADLLQPGDCVVLFGNTPYLLGRLLETLLEKTNPEIKGTLSLVYLPFSGSPNRQRPTEKLNWRHALTPERKHFFRKILTEDYELSAESLAGRRLLVVDLIGTCSGPFYLLSELLDMNGGREPWDSVYIVSLTNLPTARGKPIHDTVYEHGRLYNPSIEEAHMSAPVIPLGVEDDLVAKLDVTMSFQRYLPFFYTMYWQPSYYKHIAGLQPSRFALKILGELRSILLSDLTLALSIAS